VQSESETSEPESHSRARTDAFVALRNPHVRAFTLGQMASAMGAQFITVAIGWELYERTGDPWALGLVGLFEVLPVFLLMLPAGHAADRFPRRNVAMAASALFALAALGLTWVSLNQLPVALVSADLKKKPPTPVILAMARRYTTQACPPFPASCSCIRATRTT